MTLAAMRTYPKHATLGRGEISVTMRPLQSGDAHELMEFFRRVPEEERFYLKEDVTIPEVINSWVQHIDYNRVFPMVALVHGEIVADATLHRTRAKARSHVGEIRIVVDPKYRNQGLGTMMVRELVEIAYDNGLDNLLFELVEGKEDDAIRVSERLGFTRVTTVPNAVKDMENKLHNLVVMQLWLGDWIEWWAF